MEEAQAIARLKRGDISGLGTLVRRHQVRATRTADLIVHDRALADDIVQTAFLRAYERIDQFDASRPFAPWFLRMVVNDALKAANRTERYCSLEAQIEGEICLGELLPDPAPSPTDAAERAELHDAVWEALGKLTPVQRSAIALRYYLGLSEAEIADELAVLPGTVRWRLHKAKKCLRTLLQPFWSNERSSDERRGEQVLPKMQEEKR